MCAADKVFPPQVCDLCSEAVETLAELGSCWFEMQVLSGEGRSIPWHGE